MSPTRVLRSRVVRRISGALGTLLLALLAGLTIATATGWLAVTPVLSGSMRPGFHAGDAMLTERVSATSLHVGDIVNVKVPPKDGGGQRGAMIRTCGWPSAW